MKISALATYLLSTPKHTKKVYKREKLQKKDNITLGLNRKKKKWRSRKVESRSIRAAAYRQDRKNVVPD